MCRQHTRCSGELLSHSRGYNEGWGWTCGICSPKEPGGLWGLYGRRRNKTKHGAVCQGNPTRALVMEWQQLKLPWNLGEGKHLVEGAVAPFAGPKCKMNLLFQHQPQQLVFPLQHAAVGAKSLVLSIPTAHPWISEHPRPTSHCAAATPGIEWKGKTLSALCELKATGCTSKACSWTQTSLACPGGGIFPCCMTGFVLAWVRESPALMGFI